MNLLYGQDARVARWVSERAPNSGNGFRSDYVAIGLEDRGELVAGCVYNEYRPCFKSIAVSIASSTPRWASRKALDAFFGYPFVQLKCERLTAYTGKSMANVRAFLTRLGFLEEGVARRGFGDDDAVIYGMLREECRWLHKGHSDERLPVAAAGT